MNLDTEALLPVFIAESKKLLADVEISLQSLAGPSGELNFMDTLFRAVHTLKGCAGVFGLDQAVVVCQVTANIIHRVRKNEMAIELSLYSLLIECMDYLNHVIVLLELDPTGLLAKRIKKAKHLIKQLNQTLVFGLLKTANVNTNAPVKEHNKNNDERSEMMSQWHIHLKAGSKLLREDIDPVSFIRYLSNLGTVLNVNTRIEHLPFAAYLDSESFLNFEISLQTNADQQEIERAFDFLGDDCEVTLIRNGEMLNAYKCDMNYFQGDQMKIVLQGEVLN